MVNPHHFSQESGPALDSGSVLVVNNERIKVDLDDNLNAFTKAQVSSIQITSSSTCQPDLPEQTFQTNLTNQTKLIINPLDYPPWSMLHPSRMNFQDAHLH